MSKTIRRHLGRLAASSVLRSSAIYTVSNVGNAAIPFLLLPVLTRYLSPDDYGIVAMFQLLLATSGAFVGLNVHGAVGRKYLERDSIDLPGYVSNSFYILLFSSAACGSLLWLFRFPVASVTAVPSSWLGPVVLVSAGQFVVLTLLTLWQVQGRAFPYAAFQVSQTIANAGLSVLLVVGLGMDWRGRVIAQVVTACVFALCALSLLRRGQLLNWTCRTDYIRDALQFGVPLVPHVIGMWAITTTDRVLLTNMLGVGQTGVYTVAVQVAMPIWLLQDAFNRAWVPWFYTELKRNSDSGRLRIVKLTYLYDVVVLLGTIIFAWGASRALLFIVGNRFAGAGEFIFWLSLGNGFNGMYKMVTNYCFYEQRTKPLALITFVTGLFHLGLCYVLIRRNGAVGASQATAFAFLLSFALTWMVAARLHPMPWNLRTASEPC